MTKAKKLFFCYAREDELSRGELEKQLKQLMRENKIVTWYDRNISAGDDWKAVIDENLETSDIILLLISPDFLSSDYIHEVEMKRALERNDAGEAAVIPIMVRPVAILNEKLRKLQALPRDGRFVSKWDDPDEAWAHIASEINEVISAPNPQKTLNLTTV